MGKGVVDTAEILLNYIFCIAIHLVLILGINLRADAKEITTKRFSHLLYASLAFQFSSFISECFEGQSSAYVILYVSNLLSFLTVDIVTIAFSRYLASLLRSEKEESGFLVTLPIWSSLVDMALILILSATGKLFIIENGCYAEGKLSAVPYFGSGIVMLELLLLVFSRKECFSRRELTVIILYLVLPITPVALELVTNLYTLTSVAITLSVLLIYIFIQFVTIEQGKNREQMLEEISSTDLLTGLNNRRAYYNTISLLREDQNVGVIFCDLNRLKYTNDHFGHAAGDELICCFGKILTDTFSP